jgi:hypothetical protein
MTRPLPPAYDSAEAIHEFGERLAAIAGADVYGEDLKAAVEQVRKDLLAERGQQWLDLHWHYCWNNLLAADAVVGLGLKNEKLMAPPSSR